MTKHLDMQALHAASQCAPVTTVDLRAMEAYVMRWARNPDPGSFFEKFTLGVKWLPDFLFLAALRAMSYGGIILFLHGRPIGHVFYQQQWFRRRNEIHLFSIEVDEDHQGRNYANELVMSFLKEMGRRAHVDVLRISAGGHKAVIHMWQKVLDGKYPLDYRVEPINRPGLGWVKIVR